VPRPRRSRRTLITITVLILLSITLITVDERPATHHLAAGLKSVAHDVFSPVVGGLNAIFSPIGDFFAGAVHYGSLQAENHQLQATIGRLRLQLAETQPLRDQAREVAALEHLPFVGSTPTVTAAMTGFDLTNLDSDITLNKGRSDGVDVGEPVVAAGGLAGVVVSASHHTATVQGSCSARASRPMPP
jgi:cell shape-determining protein MreC